VATSRREGSEDDTADALALLAPPGRPDSIGRLGHYEVLEVFGRGGFGIVFRAFDDVLQRVVAVKVLAPSMATTSPARKRFLREARASARVRHENVVQVHAVEEQPLPHLVMEFIPGETLQQRLDRTGPLDFPEAVRIARQVAQGLAAAHEQGLVHRDIKPGNILIDGGPHQQVKITDFGLARAADDASLTRSGVVAGTPLYMAPEQALGETLDHRADLFSLGSVLYAMLTGRPPFRAENTLAVLKRVAEDVPRPIREVIPEVPRWLCRTVEKLHAKGPAERFQTAREVADLLADCEAQLKAHGELRDYSRIPGGQPRRRPGFAGWVATAALVLVIGLSLAWWRGWVNAFFTARPSSEAPGQVRGGQDLTLPPSPAVAPFDAAKAKAHQEAWAKSLGVLVEVENSVGMKLRLIPPGEFTMGSNPTEINWLLENVREFKQAPDWLRNHVRDEGPSRRVQLREPFYFGVHEVTVGQFREFVRATKHRTEAETKGNGRDWNTARNTWEQKPEHVWDNPRFARTDAYPVVLVSRGDAQAFCDWLGKKEGRRYVLPSEEQWEYACRAGTTTHWSFGDDPASMKRYGWTMPDSDGPRRPVGRLAANPFGLYDLHGNAAEITLNARGQMVERGSNAGDSAWRARSAWRLVREKPWDAPVSCRGFRVAVVGELQPGPKR
jgi:serine/threonine protein kinase/formylglycine-generating enzyme required for sulfatase activity